MSRLARILALACLSTAAWASPVLAQETRFQLSLAWTEPEIEPEQELTPRALTIVVTLGRGGAVSEHIRRDGGRRGGRRGGGRVQEGALGGDVDGPMQGRWKVANERTLVRLAAERSHTFAIWLTTDGASSCSVRLEWRLKPGFTAYERWAGRRDIKIRFRQPIVERASCSVF